MPGLGDQIRRFERRRRFWRHVDVGGPEDCWTWTGETDAHGLGWFGAQRADALAYRLARRAAASDAPLEHTCGNPRCVNPEHLRPAAARPPSSV